MLTAEGADTIADKAIVVATDGRDGPVHIDVPISVAGRSAGTSPYAPSRKNQLRSSSRNRACACAFLVGQF